MSLKEDSDGGTVPRELTMIALETSRFFLENLEKKLNSEGISEKRVLQEKFKEFYNQLLEKLAMATAKDRLTRFQEYATLLNEIANENKLTTVKEPFTADLVASYWRKAVMRQRNGGQIDQAKKIQMDKNLKKIPDMQSIRKKVGGANPVITTDRYVPDVPQLKKDTYTTNPCLFEKNAIDGKNSYWAVTCKRTNQDGVKQCEVDFVSDRQMHVVPRECKTDIVRFLNGYDVKKTTVEENGVKITRQEVTPDVTVLSSVVPGAMRGKPIPYEPLVQLNEDGSEVKREDMASLMAERQNNSFGMAIGGGKKPTSETKKKGGHTSSKTIGGALNGGDVTLPKPADIRKQQFKMTDQDLTDVQLGVPQGFMRQPENWKNLPALEDSSKIAFYAWDDNYGVRHIESRNKGFPFPPRYLPRSHLDENHAKYLDALVSVQYNLRSQYPKKMLATFDIAIDSIATVETSILTTLAKLEAEKQAFDRQGLLGSLKPYVGMMNPVLKEYVTREKTSVWVSPMSLRYTRVPEDSPFTNEIGALNFVGSINDQTLSQANEGGLVIDGKNYRIPLLGRKTERLGEEDSKIFGVVEDELLTTLARLQWVHGYVVNMKKQVAAIENYRPYMSPELYNYYMDFQFENEPSYFVRLGYLRMKEAVATGALKAQQPNSDFNKIATEWKPISQQTSGFILNQQPRQLDIYTVPPRKNLALF